MATINLGRVKGDPFRYEDFTPEQLAGLKGESFKFEDFTPEELESISAKVEVGTVTTLDAGEEATVTAKVEGNVTKLNFGIPQGEDAPTFTGTAAEYEAIADTIEDGTIVNITDDFVEGETLDVHVLNRVDELEDKLGSSVKTREALMSIVEEGNLADALAIKEALDYYDVGKLFNREYASLEAFVEATANDIMVPNIGRFKDTGGWSVHSSVGAWYRYMIIYQNPYFSGSTNPIRGNGIMWNADGNMWNVHIDGTKDGGVSMKWEQLNKPTITTREDLMANKVSGLFPDALAVKDAIKFYNVSQHNAANIATPEEFLELFGKDTSVHERCYIKDTGGWGPLGSINNWYMISILSMNTYATNQRHETYIDGVIWSQHGDMWILYISGKKGGNTTVNFRGLINITTNTPVENIPIENLEFTFNDVATNAGIKKEDFTFSKLYVTNYCGDMHHALRVSFKVGKKMPAGAIITLTMPNVHLNPNGDSMQPYYHPIHQFGAEILSINSFRMIYNKELDANFGVGFTLLYYSYKAKSSVLTS